MSCRIRPALSETRGLIASTPTSGN
ncbi:hypothetical protein PSCLAVI8L_130308 [Pseudoclavibacter sp. 8L]|nr:hypothetical protein PSCLAVI8L_130308 [Pseudoclavibacter sp. 8L]